MSAVDKENCRFFVNGTLSDSTGGATKIDWTWKRIEAFQEVEKDGVSSSSAQAPAAPRLAEIVDGERVVIGLPTCPGCDQLKAFLEEQKLAYRYVKWDKADPLYPELRAQLVEVMKTQTFQFPQIFEHGHHVDRQEFYEREKQKAALGAVDDDDMDF
jgi:glutaredoxin